MRENIGERVIVSEHSKYFITFCNHIKNDNA